MSQVLNRFIDQLNTVIPMFTKDRDAIAHIVKTTDSEHLMYELIGELFITNPNYVKDGYDAHISNTIADSPRLRNVRTHPRADEIDKILKSKYGDYLYERPLAKAPHVIQGNYIEYKSGYYYAGCRQYDNLSSMLNMLDAE